MLQTNPVLGFQLFGENCPHEHLVQRAVVDKHVEQLGLRVGAGVGRVLPRVQDSSVFMLGLDPDLDGVPEAEDDETRDEEHGEARHHGCHQRPVVGNVLVLDLQLRLGDDEAGNVAQLALVVQHADVGLSRLVGDAAEAVPVQNSGVEDFDPSSKSIEELTVTRP